MSRSPGNQIGIGIDFGTTNSAVALYDGDKVTLIQLEAASPIMPSATYIDRALQTRTGQDAIDSYIESNTGRTVEFSAEVIGEENVFSDDIDPGGQRPMDTVTKKVYGQSFNDAGLQGRLFRGTKRLLGKRGLKRLMVFNHPFRLVALITPILLRMRKSVDQHLGAKTAQGQILADHGSLGHPVNFEGRDLHHNELALQRLAEAYGYAGITSQRFYPEPIAAAVSYLNDNPMAHGDLMLTVDFGGGTLDFCVLRRTESHFDVVSTHGIGLGGDHIDQRLFRKLLFPLLGKGERWRRRGIDREIETQFPFEDYEDLLLNWAVSYMLNQNKYTTAVMDCIQQGGPGVHKFRRLRELIKQNYGYLVFQAIKDFKAKLSYSEEAVLDIPEIDVEVRLSRTDFEGMIEDLLQQVSKGVDDTLAKAGVTKEEVDLVLRTGGSSLIPAVKRILEDHFPGSVVEHDPFTSVATGLAIADYHGYSA